MLIMTGRMRDSFKLDGGMRNEKRKITRYRCTLRTATLTMQDWDKYSHLSGFVGLSQKIVYLSL